MKRISIISVYNKKELEEQMIASLFNRGGAIEDECEIISIDNTSGHFSSAAEAYNYALDNLAVGEILVFCHQDILF